MFILKNLLTVVNLIKANAHPERERRDDVVATFFCKKRCSEKLLWEF